MSGFCQVLELAQEWCVTNGGNRSSLYILARVHLTKSHNMEQLLQFSLVVQYYFSSNVFVSLFLRKSKFFYFLFVVVRQRNKTYAMVCTGRETLK